MKRFNGKRLYFDLSGKGNLLTEVEVRTILRDKMRDVSWGDVRDFRSQMEEVFLRLWAARGGKFHPALRLVDADFVQEVVDLLARVGFDDRRTFMEFNNIVLRELMQLVGNNGDSIDWFSVLCGDVERKMRPKKLRTSGEINYEPCDEYDEYDYDAAELS